MSFPELHEPTQLWVQAGDKKKWRAMIQHNHEQHHVGYYPTAEEAARAYDRKALLFMGPSAITNFPAADYDGVNLEADGSVEEQVTPCIGPATLLNAWAMRSATEASVALPTLTLWSRVSTIPGGCLGIVILVLSCILLHVGDLPICGATDIVMYCADEEAEEDKDVAVQGGHQGGSQVEGGHQDEQHQAGAGHLRHRG